MQADLCSGCKTVFVCAVVCYDDFVDLFMLNACLVAYIWLC